MLSGGYQKITRPRKVKTLNTRNELNIGLYQRLYLARRCEEKIVALYHENDMRTPMHMSMGSEAIAAGVCHALKESDQIFGTYRSHAIYLAKTLDADGFFAEMYGKDTSRIKGKGGSMHLCFPQRGFMGASAVVGNPLPVAVGAAFANKVQKNNKIVAVFFGDGTTDAGQFWESVNVASLMKLPVLFICEDNELAVHSPKSTRRGYQSISNVISQLNCHVLEENTTDAEVIYNLVTKAIQSIRIAEKPCFITLKYYRYLQHVGIKEDFQIGYRSRAEFEEWYKIDPIKVQREKLHNLGLSEKDVAIIEKEIDTQIGRSIEKAKKAPFCGTDELYKGVFA